MIGFNKFKKKVLSLKLHFSEKRIFDSIQEDLWPRTEKIKSVGWDTLYDVSDYFQAFQTFKAC